jgi:hypothetical protein
MKFLSAPEKDAAAKPDENVALADLAVDIKASLAAARAGAKAEEDGRAAWRDNTMKLAKRLLSGRELHQNDNNAVGAGLNAGGLGEDLISHIDRAALINMAEHAEISERVLAKTTRRSWQHIWREEIVPGVKAKGVIHVNKTRNWGARPHVRKTPTQSADPIDDVVREVIAAFSGAKAEWRTVSKMASTITRAESSVRDALKRLGDAAKPRKNADRNIEYRINGERNEPLVRASPTEPAPAEPGVAFWRNLLDAANVKIIELEEQDREKDARITQLEEQVRERDVENRRAQGATWRDRSKLVCRCESRAGGAAGRGGGRTSRASEAHRSLREEQLRCHMNFPKTRMNSTNFPPGGRKPSRR